MDLDAPPSDERIGDELVGILVLLPEIPDNELVAFPKVSNTSLLVVVVDAASFTNAVPPFTIVELVPELLLFDGLPPLGVSPPISTFPIMSSVFVVLLGGVPGFGLLTVVTVSVLLGVDGFVEVVELDGVELDGVELNGVELDGVDVDGLYVPPFEVPPPLDVPPEVLLVFVAALVAGVVPVL